MRRGGGGDNGMLLKKGQKKLVLKDNLDQCLETRNPLNTKQNRYDVCREL